MASHVMVRHINTHISHIIIRFSMCDLRVDVYTNQFYRTSTVPQNGGGLNKGERFGFCSWIIIKVLGTAHKALGMC